MKIISAVINFCLVVFSILLFVGGVLTLVIGWIYISANPNVDAKDFFQLIGITLVFFASMISVAFSEKTGRQQRKSASDLEILKARLTQIAPREHEAYHAMWSAITKYYYALQDLEIGKYNGKAVEEAEASCKDAAAHSLLVDQSHVDAFFRYWQNATYIAETAYNKRSNSQDLKDLWKSEIKGLFQQYAEIKKSFSDRLREV
jgi:hypothetical protein